MDRNATSSGHVARAVSVALIILSAALLVAPRNARADATWPLNHNCSSPWMVKAGGVWGSSVNSWQPNPGPSANFMVSFLPTKRGRMAPPLTSVFHDAWGDLKRCMGRSWPTNLTATQSDSLYKQMACHMFWSTGFIAKNGGKTWDFEAWRPTVAWPTVISPAQAIDRNKRCNWGPDTGPPLPASAPSQPQQPAVPQTPPDTGGGPTPPVDPNPQPSPVTVTLSQGPSAPSGYRYAVALSGFAPSTSVAINCRDSADPNGFYDFSLTTDASGNASSSDYCYSADGPDHWVIAGGIESNHVSWGG